MTDVKSWMNVFLERVKGLFGERLAFAGLQGSRARGEAGPDSDIDIVVILDELKAQDISRYRQMLDGLEHRELICGFLSGKAELLAWEPGELFQFYFDTVPLLGSLEDIRPAAEQAADRAVRMGACTLYHGCVHNMLHARSAETLAQLCKGAVFTLQARLFRQTGRYFRTREELLAATDGQERELLEACRRLREEGEADFDGVSEQLFRWAQKLLTEESPAPEQGKSDGNLTGGGQPWRNI